MAQDFERKKRQVGVQLFTLKNDVAADLTGTLRRVASIGYQGVELPPKPWPDVEELKSLLEETGLKVSSAHVLFERLRDDFAAVSEYCRALAITDVVLPNIPKSAYQDEAELRRTVVEIAGIAQKCHDAGLRCSYHNHQTEFENTIDGQEVYDYIFETIDADLLKAQIDTFFIEQVGKNPAQYIRRFAGRVPLLHLKDKANEPGAVQSEVGHGIIDWTAVLAAADEAGVEWLIVEQNCGDRPAFKSVQMSYDFLKSAGVV